MTTAVVVGAAGAVGRLMGKQLSTAGVRVTGIDLEPAGDDLPWEGFLCVDVAAPARADVRGVVQKTDLLVVALPESIAFAAMDRLVPELSAGALLTDVFSTKTPVSNWLQTARSDIEVLSLQPLFAPDLGFAGQNVAAVEFSGGPRSRWLMELLTEWGAQVTVVDAATHDAMCALNQVAVHASLLAYGLALESLDADVEALSTLSTPQSRALLAAVSRMAELNPEGYWAIQAGNPEGAHAREAMRQGLERLTSWVDEGDAAGFTKALGSLRERLTSPGGDRPD